MATVPITLTVNGQAVRAEVEPRVTLADFLRDELGLTGTKLGCEHGVCGACTVLVDGAAVRSCLMLAVQAEGADVLTIEGLAGDGLHPVQEAFWEHHGLQCGFCTPGMVLTAYASSRSARARARRRSARPWLATCAAALATRTSSSPSAPRPRSWPARARTAMEADEEAEK